MSPDRLVHMANQIARAFEPEGEARALPQIADHVDKFWDPRMKAALAAHIAAGGDGLSPLAAMALSAKVEASHEIRPIGRSLPDPV